MLFMKKPFQNILFCIIKFLNIDLPVWAQPVTAYDFYSELVNDKRWLPAELKLKFYITKQLAFHSFKNNN